ncbi:nicotinamide-nucleotide amidohydrolase family protein [Lentisalinibacter salinarum]|uniref:nicotinamide-nucleotide amidohydrolase family protein n=1 Tax=Lentisalinibacter salinarum TaxID=2992239 RepID=UPI0038698157
MTEFEDIAALARRTGEALLAAGRRVTTAESCTGGWIAKALTDVAGSSSWFGAGLVTYSNEAKRSLLGVRAETLDEYGAVSEETVREMAAGALAASGADIAAAVSGIAGPDGGAPDKPVGTVWFAWAVSGATPVTYAECVHFDGDRETVRRRTVCHALGGVLARIPV